MYSAPSSPNCVPITRLFCCVTALPAWLYGSQSCTRSILLLSVRSRTSFHQPSLAPRLLINHEPS